MASISHFHLAFAADPVELKNSYQLGTGDLISIQVYGEDDLVLEARLGDSGSISYPFLGDLQIAGYTVREVEQIIIRGLKGGYLINPLVSVTIKEYRQFFINGEVKSPGGFPFNPGLTIRKAISLAGGFTDRAARGSIFIIHDGESHTQHDVDLNAPIRPGDIITIEESFF
ncbi:MAG: polysaccharide export protein [Chromatiales bacterium]|nr:polysaccharide export protein [Chromatiales bacterium]